MVKSSAFAMKYVMSEPVFHSFVHVLPVTGGVRTLHAFV